MKLTHIFEAGTGFRVIDTTDRSQTGLLTLEAGEASGEKPSRTRGRSRRKSAYQSPKAVSVAVTLECDGKEEQHRVVVVER